MGMKDESATFAIFGTITRGEKTKKKTKKKKHEVILCSCSGIPGGPPGICVYKS